MKYECVKNGMAKDGRHITVGSIIELDEDYAQHLIKKGLVVAVSGAAKSKKQRAVTKPQDLEQAVEEE